MISSLQEQKVRLTDEDEPSLLTYFLDLGNGIQTCTWSSGTPGAAGVTSKGVGAGLELCFCLGSEVRGLFKLSSALGRINDTRFPLWDRFLLKWMWVKVVHVKKPDSVAALVASAFVCSARRFFEMY